MWRVLPGETCSSKVVWIGIDTVIVYGVFFQEKRVLVK